MNYKLINPNNKDLSIIETILTNRGIPLEEIEHYLHPTEANIWSPTLLGNIDLGAKMLVSHIAKGDKVLIQVDGDCDGYTSAALLINYLYRLFPTFVLNNLSYRIHTGKQHGIILDTIPQDIKLVIAPDSASNDYEVHQALKERGCDVLVLDHHLADKISEHACIVNNQLSAYPNKSLSGVGIVYKFCCYIDSVSGTDYAKDYLDLVALGVVADMVDLRDIETRYLVMSGLNQIRNLFFKGMVDKQSFQLKDGLTPFGIAFYIAPYVNATIRVGTQDEKLTLLESMLDHRGHELVPSTKRGCKGQMETLVEQACRNCTNIKNRQTKARDESLNFIEELIEEKNLLENKVLIIKLADNTKVDKSIRGLIANQLMGKYQRPVMVLTKTVKPEGIFWEGSGRGYEAATKSLKDFVHDSGMSEYEQGHDNALGISIPDDKITEFVKYANEALKDFDFTTSYEVDFIYNPDELNKEDILDNADMEFVCGPGCSGLKENLIAIEGLRLSKDDVILMSPDKKPTLKINLPDGITAIKFGSSKEEFEKLHSDLGCVTINIVGRCSKNYWNGITTPQIKITDYEIVNSMKYYF